MDCCVFPVGEPGKEGFHFCGKPSGRGPYCPEHRKVCSVGKPRGGSTAVANHEAVRAARAARYGKRWRITK